MLGYLEDVSEIRIRNSRPCLVILQEWKSEKKRLKGCMHENFTIYKIAHPQNYATPIANVQLGTTCNPCIWVSYPLKFS